MNLRCPPSQWSPGKCGIPTLSGRMIIPLSKILKNFSESFQIDQDEMAWLETRRNPSDPAPYKETSSFVDQLNGPYGMVLIA